MTFANDGAGMPSFIIIGTMKGGTSSLYRYLSRHPEICMSKRKETDFFIKKRNFHKGLHWYRSLFLNHAKVCGEASPNYSKRHLHHNVPKRIYRLIPDALLIYTLRDPIDRIISHYLHNQMKGRDTRPFAEALAAHSYLNNYVQTSMYWFQLSAFLRYFSLKRILVTTTEELKENRAETLRSMFQFIGVDPDFKHREFVRLFHQTPAVTRPFLSQEHRDRLVEHLAPDIDQLRTLTGLRFERWCL